MSKAELAGVVATALALTDGRGASRSFGDFTTLKMSGRAAATSAKDRKRRPQQLRAAATHIRRRIRGEQRHGDRCTRPLLDR